MHRYVVNFFKVVPDGSGHDHRVLQRRTVVHARSDVSALFEAKALFREEMNVADWRLRADTCEIFELEHAAA